MDIYLEAQDERTLYGKTPKCPYCGHEEEFDNKNIISDQKYKCIKCENSFYTKQRLEIKYASSKCRDYLY